MASSAFLFEPILGEDDDDFEEEVDADQVSGLDVFPVIPCVTDDPTSWL